MGPDFATLGLGRPLRGSRTAAWERQSDVRFGPIASSDVRGGLPTFAAGPNTRTSWRESRHVRGPFLRHDPNVIMVGEIRDQETAEIACRAALVGRLVLSTLHTNSPEEAETRLIDLGVEPLIVKSVLRGVLGHRLVIAPGQGLRLRAEMVGAYP